MRIDRRHINILEVISVIFFSIFGSYLVAVDPAFNETVTLVEVFRLIAILISGIALYFAVFRMKKIDEEAKIEFHGETDLTKKAERSIDDRYESYFVQERAPILLRVLVSVVALGLFVSLEFLPETYLDRINHELIGESLKDNPVAQAAPALEGSPTTEDDPIVDDTTIVEEPSNE